MIQLQPMEMKTEMEMEMEMEMEKGIQRFLNKPQKMDGIRLLQELTEESIPCVFLTLNIEGFWIDNIMEMKVKIVKKNDAC